MSNPQMKNVGRAAYELPYLVNSLGDLASATVLTAEQADKVAAIECHADDAISAITAGLESIGAAMSLIGHSDDVLSGFQIAGFGDLIKHLAVELEYLHDVETDMRAHRRLPISTNKTATGATGRATTQRQGATA